MMHFSKLFHIVPQLLHFGHVDSNALITLRAKFSSAVYCYQSCLCVCNGRAACVCVCGGGLLPRQLKIACIDPHQTGFVGKGRT